MALQVLPPDLLETPKDKIETKDPQPYFKPSSLTDGTSEEFRLLGCYETGHAVMGWQYASEAPDPKTGELRFNGYVVTRTHPGQPQDIARETDWSKPDRPKIDGTQVKPRRFLAWVATSATRGRLEVLFIEQKSLREQLTEILQEIDDYTWTEDGLANFSIKISRKGTGLETTYSILPKVRKVPDKIRKEWQTTKNSIWLPNFFEGKDPFEGKQTDQKGLPAGGTDKLGSTVMPKIKKESTSTTNTEF
tara:strand:+ start:19733 stop:20476 length:744 start_codon:yes stop_codon:yes gene_type:complete